MEVTYYFRKPKPGFHSIERVFNQVINHLPDGVTPRIYKLKNEGKGVMPRIKSLWEARINKGPINHITGDISYIALALPKKGLVVTFHDLESLERDSWWRNLFLKWLWIKLPAQKAEKITVISEHTKQKMLRYTGIDESKLVIIPNPLPDGYVFTPKEFNVDQPEILAIGTKKNKNLEGTIQAVEGISCRLVIVGELTDTQKELLKQKKIAFLNFVNITDEEMLQRYKACDMLCFPSFFEGFGMPIIEAQAIGRPVITSNFGAMKEVARDGALLVNPYDFKDIRNAIVNIINDKSLRAGLIEKGRMNASMHNPHRIAYRNAELYKTLNSKF